MPSQAEIASPSLRPRSPKSDDVTVETCEQRNMREGWGCKCHGMTFCPDLVCIGLEDDVPVFVRRDSEEARAALKPPPSLED